MSHRVLRSSRSRNPPSVRRVSGWRTCASWFTSFAAKRRSFDGNRLARGTSMSILVLAEHDGAKLLGATHCTVSAARNIGAPVEVLVAGSEIETVAAEAARIDGVAKVLK